MQTKTIHIEQTICDTKAIDEIINREIEAIIKSGHAVIDVRLAIGRDADVSAGAQKRFAMTALIMFVHESELEE